MNDTSYKWLIFFVPVHIWNRGTFLKYMVHINVKVKIIGTKYLKTFDWLIYITMDIINLSLFYKVRDNL